MAVAMEAGNLVTVAFLARYRVGLPLRVTLVVLVAGIAAINGLGVFSQLVAAHLGDRIERAGKAQTGAAEPIACRPRSMPGSKRKAPSWPI